MKDSVLSLTHEVVGQVSHEFINREAAREFGIDTVYVMMMFVILIIGGGVMFSWLIHTINKLLRSNPFSSSNDIVQKIMTDNTKMVKEITEQNHETMQELVKALTKEQKEGFGQIVDAIERIESKSGLTFLSQENVFSIVDITFKSHILQKLSITRKKLEQGDIENRRKEIIRTLRGQFEIITSKECRDLDKYSTEIGKIGTLIFSSIDFNALMNEFSLEFFGAGTIEEKLSNIEKLFDRYVEAIKVMLQNQYNNKFPCRNPSRLEE